MINYLRFVTEFWFSSASKFVEWIYESLFVKKLLRRGTMALTKKMKLNRDGDNGGGGFHGEEEELELGLGSVRFTRGLGRKRILISSSSRSAVEIPVTESSPSPSPVKSSLKRQRSITRLESLPQELLIEVIKCVNHEDLKNLYLVSKSIKEASLMANMSHFAITTPRKIRAFRNPIDTEDSSYPEGDTEPPNAPKHYRWTKAKRKEQLSSVSVALFT